MKFRFFYLILFVFLLNENSYSQANIDSIYGLNPVLYNGQVYAYLIPNSVIGTQFLYDTKFIEGSVTINDKIFNNVNLNYDIYNQEILLEFKIYDRVAIIKLNKERVQNFTMGNNSFTILTTKNEEPKIYQSFGEGQYKLLFKYKKLLELTNRSNSQTYKFSKPILTKYLKNNEQILIFRNKRTFLSLFEEVEKKKLAEFLKKNKINVKRATYKELNQLINFCNTL